MKKIEFPETIEKLTEDQEYLINHQIQLEFDLIPEYEVSIAGINMYPWHFSKSFVGDILIKRYGKLLSLPFNLALISTSKKDLQNLSAIYDKYKQFNNLPVSILLQLFNASKKVFIYPNYETIFSYFEENKYKFDYLLHTTSNDTFLTSYFKDVLNVRSQTSSFERLEKSLGVLWTEDMIGNLHHEEIDKNKKEDFFFMPLGLQLSQNAKKLYEQIVNSIRRKEPETKFHPKSSFEQPKNEYDLGKEREKSSFDTDINIIKVNRYNTIAESLINAPKELFKETISKVIEEKKLNSS